MMNKEQVLQRMLPLLKFDDCWIWRGNPNSDGYGVLQVNGVRDKTHRWMWKVCVGPLSSECDLDHDWACKNKLCCNPDHLEPVTRGENARRAQGVFNGVCRNGHKIEGDNARPHGRYTQCAICHRAACKRWRDKRNAYGG